MNSLDSKNDQTLWQVAARVPLAIVEGAVELFEKQKFLGVSFTECDDALPSPFFDNNGFPIASEFIIDGFSQTKPDLNFLKNAIDCLFQLLGIMPPPRFIINITPVDDTDWLEACYIGMPAQHFGRFYIYGSHIKDPVPEGLLPVLVDAATAFGSGEHPTTAGCLKLLSRLSDTHNFKTILDMGCGSGILGIASKKCWPQASVILADNDAESVRVATLNASANQADITCYQSEGFSNSLITNAGPFDLTLANILAKPLCDLAPDFMQHTSSKGYVIVSGLLSRQGELVTNAFLNAGFKLYDSLLIEDWLSLVFQKV